MTAKYKKVKLLLAALLMSGSLLAALPAGTAFAACTPTDSSGCSSQTCTSPGIWNASQNKCIFSVSQVCTAQNTSACGESNCSSSGGTWNAAANACTFSAPTSGTPTSTDPAAAGDATPDPAIASGNCSDSSLKKCDLVSEYLNPFIQFLSALVGVAVVASIIIGGIQYGSSAGDPQAAAAAKNRIRNSIVALITFLFLYALLNFLIPGGLFNS